MLRNKSTVYLSQKTGRCPGGGRPQKWNTIENFITEKLKHYWEIGAPLTKEQLQFLVQQEVASGDDACAVKMFIMGKRNTLLRFIARTLKKNKWSVRKITISQSIPVDWRKKSEDNAARIHDKFLAENVDVVVNADETFLLFHPFGEKVIAPTGMKRVGSAVQVDNEKFGATVLIACEYRTSSILPPMIIFTGVYCAKLMTEWAPYQKGNCF